MLTLLSTIVLLGVIVILHEFGHYLAARAVGAPVSRFSVGFGRPVLKRVWRGTEWSLGWIPFGGYVLVTGLDDMGRPDAPVVPRIGRWARVLILLGGVIMNLLLALLIFSWTGYHYGVPAPLAPRVSAAASDSVRAALPDRMRPWRAVPPGAVIRSVDGHTVDDWSQAMRHILAPRNSTISLGLRGPTGPLALALPAAVSPAERDALMALLQPEAQILVAALDPAGGAARAGVRPGERLMAVDGAPVYGTGELPTLLQAALAAARTGDSTVVVTLRDSLGAVRTLRLRPTMAPDERGAPVPRLGIYFTTPRLSPGPLEAVQAGAGQTWSMLALIGRGFAQIVQRALLGRGGTQMGSVIMIGQMSGDAAHRGLEAFLVLMAFVSLNIAVLNLVPIPVLDGGQLALVGLEAYRGRPLTPRSYRVVMGIGMGCVAGLMVWGVGTDLMRLLR